MKPQIKFLVAAVYALLISHIAHADIVLSGDLTGTAAGGGVGTPTITLETDLTFEITNPDFVMTPVFVRNLVFDDWTDDDGARNSLTDLVPQQVDYEINGVASSRELRSLNDNNAAILRDITSNDGFLSFVDFPVFTGDSVTFKAGSYTFNQNASFNPLLENQTFSGNVFLTTGGGLRLSNVVSVTSDILGDINNDGSVNLLDVAPFVELLSSGDFQAEADLNQDGVVNLLDVAPFVDLLTGG